VFEVIAITTNATLAYKFWCCVNDRYQAQRISYVHCRWDIESSFRDKSHGGGPRKSKQIFCVSREWSRVFFVTLRTYAGPRRTLRPVTAGKYRLLSIIVVAKCMSFFAILFSVELYYVFVLLCCEVIKQCYRLARETLPINDFGEALPPATEYLELRDCSSCKHSRR